MTDAPGTLPFFQVDAFTDRPFAGNPAAVVPLSRWPDDDLLQAIAAENNLSETAFTVPLVAPGESGEEADYALRWFTPTTEVALCGHATLASGHVLLGARARVRFATRQAGVLEVARGPNGAGYAMTLPAYPPASHPLPAIAAAVGGPVAETLWHPAGYAVLAYPDEAAVRALAPDFAALRRLDNILYIACAPGDGADVAARVFAPVAGIDEDPVTGSAWAVLAPLWAGRLGRDAFTGHQVSARGGRLGCRLAGERVVLTGACVTVIEGRLAVQP